MSVTVNITDKDGKTRTFEALSGIEIGKLSEQERAKLVEVGRGGDWVPALETTLTPESLIAKIVNKGREMLG